MKTLKIAVLLLLPFSLYGQNKISGIYNNYFFCSIQLNTNNTFRYSWHFDLSGGWAIGTWRTFEDTIFFNVEPVYDTIIYNYKNGNSMIKLDLSADTVSERLKYKQLMLRGLSSVVQDTRSIPKKLFYKNEKLYQIKDGKLMRERRKSTLLPKRRKYPTWYFKSKE